MEQKWKGMMKERKRRREWGRVEWKRYRGRSRNSLWFNSLRHYIAVHRSSRQTVQTPNCLNVKLSKRQTVQTSNCPDVKLSRRQTVQTSNCPDGKLSRCQTIQTSNCRDVKLSRRQTVQTSNCPDVKLSRRQTAQTVNGQDVKLPRCQTVQTSNCPDVKLSSCQTFKVTKFWTIEPSKNLHFHLANFPPFYLSSLFLCRSVKLSSPKSIKRSNCPAVNQYFCLAWPLKRKQLKTSTPKS